MSKDAFEFRLVVRPTGRMVSYDLRNTLIITNDHRILIPDGPVTMPEMGEVQIEARDAMTGGFKPIDSGEEARNTAMRDLFELCYGATRPSK